MIPSNSPAPRPSFVAFVDEAGDEGFKFAQGSSKWFVLGAVVVPAAEELQTVKLVDRVRVQLGWPPKKALHFRDLRHERRLVLVDRLSRANVATMAVLLDKTALTGAETVFPREKLYFYLAKFLLERISWYCRDCRTQFPGGDGTASVVFSNRAGMSYESLRSYLQLLQSMAHSSTVGIDWSVIAPARIKASQHSKSMGLQLADAVAGSFWNAVNPNRLGFTEDRYARMLKPTVYKRSSYLGYGIKLWPKSVEERIGKDESLAWIRQSFS
jgi:hypothetical protein